MTNTNRRRGSLGGLIAATAEPTGTTPAAEDGGSPQIAPQALPAPADPAARETARPPARQWIAIADETGQEIARVTASTQAYAITETTRVTGRKSGFSLFPAEAARVAEQPSRGRRRKVYGKLTAQISGAVLDALDLLTQRDGTLKYDEIEAALRSHLAAKHIPIDEES